MSNSKDIGFISMHDVVNIVCGFFEISRLDLFKRTNNSFNVEARQFFFSTCIEKCDNTLSEIGSFGNYLFNCKSFNYSTVKHAHVKILNQCEIYKETRDIRNYLNSCAETSYLINQIQEEKNKNFNESTFLVDNINLIELTK